MMYWLKIILVCILSLCFFRISSEHINCSYSNNTQYLLTINSKSESSVISSSFDNYLQRTINHILQSAYSDGIFICGILSNANKDNSENKYIASYVISFLRTLKMYHCQADMGILHIVNNYIIHSKNYYVYTLKRIII